MDTHSPFPVHLALPHTGLTAAMHLAQRGWHVTVIDKRARVRADDPDSLAEARKYQYPMVVNRWVHGPGGHYVLPNLTPGLRTVHAALPACAPSPCLQTRGFGQGLPCV
jgi:monoamine oxidase